MNPTKEATTLPPHVDYWKNRWDESRTGWHKSEVHPNLIKYMDRLVSKSTTKKVFVPLCGKTKDIPYLLSQGFKVFALEGVKQPIEELDKENGLNLKFDQEESIYHTEDNQLQIYLGDLFKCPIEKWGPVNFIWDRGSFIAIDYHDRPSYIEVMKRSLSNSDCNDFRYLLETVTYEKSVYPGPPRSVDAKDLEIFFGEWTDVETLCVANMDNANILKAVTEGKVEDEPCCITTYLLTPKKNT